METGWLQTLLGARNDGHHLVLGFFLVAFSVCWVVKVVAVLAGLVREGGASLGRDDWELIVGSFAFFLLMTFLFGWDLVLDPSTSPQRWLERNGLLGAALASVYGLNVIVTATVLLVDGARRVRRRRGQGASQ
jgi:hypothetical protein